MVAMMMKNVKCYDDDHDVVDDIDELPLGKHVKVLEEAILHDTLGTTAMRSDDYSIIATE